MAVAARGRIPHPPVAERAARGKAARSGAPRSGHADWAPATGRRAPEAVLLEQAADRVPELVPLRHERMLASPFGFFRGAAGIDGRRPRGDAATPGSTVQLCGDAHLSNFGGFAAPDRELVFDINDFDETARGPVGVGRQAAGGELRGRGPRARARRRRRGATPCEAAVGSYRDRDAAIRDDAQPRALVRAARRRRGSSATRATG